MSEMIIATNPTVEGEATALYRFGQLLTTRGKLVGARKTFKTLSAVRPDSYKAWLGFAQALHALHRFTEAVQAYQEAIRLRPELALAHRSQLFTFTASGGWALELQGFYLFSGLAVLFLGSGRMAIRPD